MKTLTVTAIRIMKMVIEAISSMISAVCVGNAVAEDAAEQAWQQAKKQLLALLEALFPVVQLPDTPLLTSSCNSYLGGKGLTLALIAESIHPRAPNY